MFKELRTCPGTGRLPAASFRSVVTWLAVCCLIVATVEVRAADVEDADSGADLASLDLLNNLFLEGDSDSPSDAPVLGPPAELGPAIAIDLPEIPDEAPGWSPPATPAWAQPEAGASELTDALFASEPLGSDGDSEESARIDTAESAVSSLQSLGGPISAPKSWLHIDGSPSVNARLAMPILPLNIIAPIVALPEPSAASQSVEVFVPTEILELIANPLMVELAAPTSGDPLWDALESTADRDAEDAEDAIEAAGGPDVLVDAPVEEPSPELAFSLNRSEVREIAEALGLDPRRARHIVEFRTLHGLFASADDLSQVMGITDEMAFGWDKLGILNFD